MTLSRAQLNALRYVKGRQLYAADINNGNGNRRRTLLSLLKFGMLDWDLSPIYHGRVVLTAAGEDQLQKDLQSKRAAKAKLGRIGRPVHWSGMCPAGKHGLDYEGQRCDLCPSMEAQT